jgi:hypothetical protein
VGFGVRSETEASSGRRRLHPLQILRHPSVVHEHTRRPEVGNLHPDILLRGTARKRWLSPFFEVKKVAVPTDSQTSWRP